MRGLVQRFIPSEFGLDPYKTQVSDLDHNFYSSKAEIRQLVEALSIPYTVVSCNFFMSYLLPSLVQPDLKAPPREKYTVFGSGDVKGLSISIILCVLSYLKYTSSFLSFSFRMFMRGLFSIVCKDARFRRVYYMRVTLCFCWSQVSL